MVKIIAFNGPPNSGKDTGAEYLKRAFNANVLTLAKPVYEMVSRIYGVPINDLYEHKSKTHPLLGEKTTREVMTFWGEQTKYLHGQDIWINKTINDMRKRFSLPFYVISDLGFQVELDRLVDEFGAENIFINFLYRKDCSFVDDSRNYITPYRYGRTLDREIAHARIENNGTIAEYETKLKNVVEEWLNK